MCPDSSKDHQVSRVRPGHSFQWNRPVERDQPSVIAHGKAKKMYIRDLRRTRDILSPKQLSVKQRRILAPMGVFWLSAQHAEPLSDLCRSRIHCRVARI